MKVLIIKLAKKELSLWKRIKRNAAIWNRKAKLEALRREVQMDQAEIFRCEDRIEAMNKEIVRQANELTLFMLKK